jgi:hypothetical protein
MACQAPGTSLTTQVTSFSPLPSASPPLPQALATIIVEVATAASASIFLRMRISYTLDH